MAVINLSSANVDVFPSGFRSSEYGASAQITEENLTQFKILSSNSNNNAFYIERDDKSIILGLDGYIFNISGVEGINGYDYVSIAFRYIDTIGWVLANIDNIKSINEKVAEEILVLDDDEKFKGLRFSELDESEEFTDNSTGKVIGKIKSYEISKLKKNLKFDASEIRNTTDSLDSIVEKFNTKDLTAINATISNINGISINPSEESEESVTVRIAKDTEINDNIKVTPDELKVGDNKILSKNGTFKAHNLEIHTPEDLTTFTLEQDFTIPATAETNQVLGSNSKWVNYNSDNIGNTIVYRNVDGNTAVSNLIANSVNDISIKNESNVLEISTNELKNSDKSKFELGKGFNLEVKDDNEFGHLAVIKANENGSSETYIAIRSNFNTAEDANVTIGSSLSISDEANGVAINGSTIELGSNSEDSKTKSLTLSGTLTLPSNNDKAEGEDTKAIPAQSIGGDWTWYPISSDINSNFKHIPITDDKGKLHVEISTDSAISMNVARANNVKINSEFGVNDIKDPDNKENIKPLLFIDKTYIESSLLSENKDVLLASLPANYARYSEPAIVEDIYLDNNNNLYLKDKNISCKLVNDVKICKDDNVKISDNENTVFESKGKILIQNINNNRSIISFNGDLNLPANCNYVSDNNVQIFSQKKIDGVINSVWTTGTSDALKNSICCRDGDGISSFNNIKLTNFEDSDYAVYVGKDGLLESRSLETTPADVDQGDSTINVVSDIEQDSNGKITFTKSDIQIANNQRYGIVKGIPLKDPVSSRNYEASIDNDGKIVVNVPWKEIDLEEAGEQGQIILTRSLPGKDPEKITCKINGLATDGTPRFDTVTAQTFLGISDIRLKENIQDYKCSKSILDLPIKKFDYIDGSKNNIGCIAQDLQEICPELVIEDNKGYLTINESKLIYLLIQEVKDLKAKVDMLR